VNATGRLRAGGREEVHKSANRTSARDGRTNSGERGKGERRNDETNAADSHERRVVAVKVKKNGTKINGI